MMKEISSDKIVQPECRFNKLRKTFWYLRNIYRVSSKLPGRFSTTLHSVDLVSNDTVTETFVLRFISSRNKTQE